VDMRTKSVCYHDLSLLSGTANRRFFEGYLGEGVMVIFGGERTLSKVWSP
jgi:hypothetical protein